MRGQHAADGADDRPHEQEEPELANRRTADGRRPVDRCEQHVTDVGPFECERPAAAARSQPDRDDDCDDDGEPVRAVDADVRDCDGRQLAVADQTGTDEDGDAAQDRGQVRLVERVDPVDVGKPLAAPDAPPLEERVFEVGVRISGRDAVQRYSWTSSMSVPKAVFGWTKATVVPREPGPRVLVDHLAALVLDRLQRHAAVAHAVADVVQALALASRGTWPPASRHGSGVSSWM